MNDPQQGRWPPAGLLAGFAAGAVGGLAVLGGGGRLLMMGLRLADGGPTLWSLGGTIQVVLPGLVVGAPAGVLYTLVRRRLPGPPVAQGLVFGALHGTAWVLLYFLRPAGPVELAAFPVSGAVGFGALLLGFGVVVAVLERRWRAASSGAGTAAAWWVLAVALGMLAFAVGVLVLR